MPRTTPPVIEQRSFVNGNWVTMEDTGRPLCDPNTAQIRQNKLTTNNHDVDLALQSAQDFHLSFQDEVIDLETRVDVLNAVADRIDGLVEEIAQQDSINVGASITTSRIIAGALGDRIRGAVTDATSLGESVSLSADVSRPVEILHKPLGPAVIVGPWNAPTFTTLGKVAAALLAGCPVILKPSENAPSGCQMFSELVVDEIARRNLNPNFFQLIQGGSAVGSLLTDDPRVASISFTGGVASGRVVATAAASHLAVMQMELGSNNPAIVRADADITATAKSLVEGISRLNGQWCEAPGKILVHHSVHDDLRDAVMAEINALNIGDSLEDSTVIGPMAFERQLHGLESELARLESLGGIRHSARDLPDLGGWFIAPGIVTNLAPEQATNELFGPLFTVHAVKDDAEALAAANAPGGGLDAFVFSQDIDKAMLLGSRMRAGEVRINGTFMSDLAAGSQQSFWGTSGIGGHAPQYGVRFFMGDRVVGVDRKDFAL